MTGKKITILLLASLVLLAGCSMFKTNQKKEVLYNTSSHDNLPDTFTNGETAVSMQSDKKTYTLPVDEITLMIANSGPSNVVFGEHRSLEKLQEDTWYEVPYREQLLV